MRSPTGTIQDAIEKLQAEIDRLNASSKMMRDANSALASRDDAALRAMGFTDAHIADLLMRVGCGRTGFPDYALRNNDSNVRLLKKCMAELKAGTSQRGHH